MAVFYRVLPSPNPYRLFFHDSSIILSNRRNRRRRRRDFPLAASVASCPSIDVDSLKNEFSGSGISFSGITSDSCAVRMALDDGSVATLMLPSGLITSFKVPMWHGGTTELLHTWVSSEDEDEDDNTTAVSIHGGLSLAFTCELSDSGVVWSPSTWALHQVRGSSQKSIQVELISKNPQDNVEVRHIINLQPDLLTSDILVSNASPSTLHLIGSTITHLTVSTPEATYAVGLQGSDFLCTAPIRGDFSIRPSHDGTKNHYFSRKIWGSLGPFRNLFAGLGTNNKINDDVARTGSIVRDANLEGEEIDNYKHLTQRMSRIYTNAPRNFTLIDRGRRNSVIISRQGFSELYVFSPGSRHKWYGEYSFICVGQSALLKPIILDSQTDWRGRQQLLNPNS